jgi:hypothetical protein
MPVKSPTSRSLGERRSRHRARALLVTAALASSAVLGAGALAGTAAAAPSYTFTTLNNQADPTFNQLLGINLDGVIAGYFGSGAQGHPNRGYLLYPSYKTKDNYVNENFPGSVQTQVTGLNDLGVSVGFYSRQNNTNGVNENDGFYAVRGHAFHTVRFPTSNNSTPPVNQLLGVNDNYIAVGFYNDAAGNSHGYTYNITKHRFRAIKLPGKTTSNTAAAINNHNDLAGFATVGKVTEAFLLRSNGRFKALKFPGAAMTQAFGVNDQDEVVGAYTDNANKMHGFTWTPQHGFNTVDDPNGIGATTINGVNDFGELVGFYTDAAGNTDGMLATPAP